MQSLKVRSNNLPLHFEKWLNVEGVPSSVRRITRSSLRALQEATEEAESRQVSRGISISLTRREIRPREA